MYVCANDSLVMKSNIIGRHKEIEAINGYVASPRSEFIAVYGRRRVGKTYLIKELFEGQMSFKMTGMDNVGLREQLLNFHIALRKYRSDFEQPKNWIEAFDQLSTYLGELKTDKKIVFIDELPWFDTHKSGFVSAFENFWNNWAYYRTDIKLIVCGSATSWMLNKLINGRGGLHNRVTHQMRISPFSLAECEEYFNAVGCGYERAEILESYMVTGGVAFYMSLFNPHLSVAQNIDEIFFAENGELKNEFKNLYRELYKQSDIHVKIVTALASKSKGLSRNEIIQSASLTNNGALTVALKELEECGFIRSFVPIAKRKQNTMYQLIDAYSLFYFKMIRNNVNSDALFWTRKHGQPVYYNWCGYAFEILCLNHIGNILRALGISGMETRVCSWSHTAKGNDDEGCQIDLLIDRKDNCINVCEMKYSADEFEITKDYATHVKEREELFKKMTSTRKTLITTYITPFGLKNNMYSRALKVALDSNCFF